ncbi:MAG: hypothetical protein AAF828_11140, partial [Bacteroidota bacterium]
MRLNKAYTKVILLMHRFSHWFLLTIFLLVTTLLWGQSADNWVTISETDRFQESHPIISANHQTLYFSRYRHPRNLGAGNQADVWIRNRQADGSWGRSLNAGSPINTNAADRVLGISADGRRLAILREGATTYLDILVKGDRSWRISGSWSLPPLGFATFDLEAQKLVFSQYTTTTNGDLYTQTALANGEWSAAQPLQLINTSATEDSPYLAPDGQTIYFRRNDIWHLSRFDPTTSAFKDAISLASYLPSNWEALTVSITQPDRIVGTITPGEGRGVLQEGQLPLPARPIASRLLEGKIKVLQSPTDRINGASIRLLVDGQERQLYPDKMGYYTLVVPAEGYARIVADAPGYFAPSRALNATEELDRTLADSKQNTYSSAYYEREQKIQEIHRNMAATRAEM